jgi:hypothetical protein
MGVLGVVLLVLFILAAILLVLLVLVQNEEGDSLGGFLRGGPPRRLVPGRAMCLPGQPPFWGRYFWRSVSAWRS